MTSTLTEAQAWIAAAYAARDFANTPCIPGCGHTAAQHDDLVRDLQTAAWLDTHGIEYGYAVPMLLAVAADADAAEAEDLRRDGCCEACREAIHLDALHANGCPLDEDEIEAAAERALATTTDDITPDGLAAFDAYLATVYVTR